VREGRVSTAVVVVGEEKMDECCKGWDECCFLVQYMHYARHMHYAPHTIHLMHHTPFTLCYAPHTIHLTRKQSTTWGHVSGQC
jgi:hypothetical protein